MAKRTKKVTPEAEQTPAETPKAMGRKKKATSANQPGPETSQTASVPGAPEMSGADEFLLPDDIYGKDSGLTPKELRQETGKRGEFGDAPLTNTSVHPEYCTRFTEFDIHLFREGRHYKLYEKLGSHIMSH